MRDWKSCCDCGDDTPTERYQAFCIICERTRERTAQAERKSWTVVQEYGKGGYMFVTSDSARKVLTQTNQKNLRSDI
jgi:hypothetical protein